MPRRNRRAFVVLIIATVALGLASRKFAVFLPWWMAKNAGVFCFAIKLLKFSSTPWLVAARQSNWGALVFGRGFHLSNLVCYTLGVTLGAGIEAAFRYQRRN